jgi:hypothetical protein
MAGEDAACSGMPHIVVAVGERKWQACFPEKGKEKKPGFRGRAF